MNKQLLGDDDPATSRRPALLVVVPSLLRGGAEKSAVRVAELLSDSFEVTLVTYLNVENPVTTSVASVALGLGGASTWLTKSSQMARRAYALRRLKKRLNPIATISFLEGADYINILSGRPGAIILSVRGSKQHDQNLRNARGWVRRKVLMPLLYRFSDAIVAISDGIRAELTSVVRTGKSGPVIYTVGNSVDVDRLGSLAQERFDLPFAPYWCDDGPYAVCHGRIAPEKNLEALVSLISLLRSGGLPLKLLLVGSGPSEADVLEAGRRMGLTTRRSTDEEAADAELLLIASAGNPFPLLRRASFYVQTSSHEGFGSSLLEALGLGLPCLVADVPYGPSEILDWEKAPSVVSEPAPRAPGGFLLPPLNSSATPADWDAWVSAAQTLLGSSDRRQRIAGEATAVARYWSSDRERELWHTAIRSTVLARNGP